MEERGSERHLSCSNHTEGYERERIPSRHNRTGYEHDLDPGTNIKATPTAPITDTNDRTPADAGKKNTETHVRNTPKDQGRVRVDNTAATTYNTSLASDKNHHTEVYLATTVAQITAQITKQLYVHMHMN